MVAIAITKKTGRWVGRGRREKRTTSREICGRFDAIHLGWQDLLVLVFLLLNYVLTCAVRSSQFSLLLLHSLFFFL